MPLLLRFIIQRLLIFLYSFLAFIGIAPESHIPTEAEANAAIEERQERIAEFFSEPETQERIQGIIDETDKLREIGLELIDGVDNVVERENQTSISPTNTISQIIQETVQEAGSVEKSLTTRNTIDDFVVNIVCSKKDGNQVNVSTGSGVIIDPSGVIVTNAHVGQFVLIEDNYNLYKCSVYKENIPTLGYTVDVLYVSPEWIRENYRLISSDNPRGTGEFDYAFLYITGNVNPASKKPSSFPYSNIALSDSKYDIGRTVKVAGYPGAPTKISEIFSSGILRKDTVSIIEVFTFNKYSIDVITTEKTDVGAKGSSGGGVFDSNNNLIAIISTTNGEQNDAHINAITTTYINESLEDSSGKNISSILTDPEGEVESFSWLHGESLAKLLKDQID